MFKYLIVLALALVAVMAAPPAPGAPAAAAPKDLATANQLLYGYGYPSVYSGYPYAYTSGYGYPSYYGGLGGVYYG
ncbi:unnamed protein product [Allacma fusca]|uniref:Neuropeptide-like 4 n=1 Tax=Allacma fusca TaxID=39272 RepID=A0A8J2Q4L8_9HEXA|nr:unnamed protein product [Allacma fusca]